MRRSFEVVFFDLLSFLLDKLNKKKVLCAIKNFQKMQKEILDLLKVGVKYKKYIDFNRKLDLKISPIYLFNELL